jgi:hypothetical protein
MSFPRRGNAKGLQGQYLADCESVMHLKNIDLIGTDACGVERLASRPFYAGGTPELPASVIPNPSRG